MVRVFSMGIYLYPASPHFFLILGSLTRCACAALVSSHGDGSSWLSGHSSNCKRKATVFFRVT